MNAYIVTLLSALILASHVQAASFSSIHAFGDSLSTTDADVDSFEQYLHNDNGYRYCNGRVWVEVLAAWQGLAFVQAHNTSAYGYDIVNVQADLPAYIAPNDVDTALYVLWVSGADFANLLLDQSTPDFDTPAEQTASKDFFDSFVAATLSTHKTVITTLYNKGVRNLLIPNLPDLSVAPAFNLTSSERDFIRARVQDFNSGLKNLLEEEPLWPPDDLKVWSPDVFSLFDDILETPSAYNLQNPVTFNPPNFDYGIIPAVVAGGTPNLATGPGTDYVFWDDLNPTAAVQFILADYIQSEVCPPRIDSITQVTEGFELQFSNLQVGRSGSIEGSENLIGWDEDESITPSSTSGSEILNPTADKRFFRLSFDSGWIWP